MLSTKQTNTGMSISMVIFIQVTSLRRPDPTSPSTRIPENALSVCRRLQVRLAFHSTTFDGIRLPVIPRLSGRH